MRTPAMVALTALLIIGCDNTGQTDQWYCYGSGSDMKVRKFDGPDDRPCTKVELDRQGIAPDLRPAHQR